MKTEGESWLDFLQNLSDMVMEGAYLRDEFKGDAGEDAEDRDLDDVMHRVIQAGEAIGLVRVDPRTSVLRGTTLVASRVTDLEALLAEVRGPTPTMDVHPVSGSTPGITELRGTLAGTRFRMMIRDAEGWVFVVAGESSKDGDADAIADILRRVLNSGGPR